MGTQTTSPTTSGDVRCLSVGLTVSGRRRFVPEDWPNGEHIYKGSTSWGAPIATVKGEYVYRGTGFLSGAIAVIDGEYVYQGTNKLGGPIANVSGGGRMSAAAAVYLLLM